MCIWMAIGTHVLAQDTAWVTVKSLNKRACPSLSCKPTGKLAYGEKIKIYQEMNGWVKITATHPAEWVFKKYLSTNRGYDTVGLQDAIKTSDDYQAHYRAFAKATRELIRSGRCTGEELKSVGGWIKSLTSSEPIYFTYCGGRGIQNRIYLNVKTGELY